jgi:tRNA pseudouridine38-40 synthase
MRNIRLLVSYDGTDFAGWQVQNDQRSVQGVLEGAVSDLLGDPVCVTGAGRTDSGVHATGQVCNFRTENIRIPDVKFRDALNARLPRDLRILSSELVHESFNSRRDARSRQYEYHIITGPSGPAHMARFSWLVKKLPPLTTLNDMARVLCGTHDFATFTAAGDASRSTVRHINHAVFLCSGSEILFRINGNAFLWRMVRSLLGTMIDLGLRGGGGEEMRSILEARDRESAGPTAPARGLFLTGVAYGTD